MANDCWNNVTITGNLDTLKKIQSKFKPFESELLNYSSYHKLFETDVKDVEGDDWGPKWFAPSTSIEGDKLIIKGDSAWMPAIPLIELISEEYEVDCYMKYEETGMDFAGEMKWERGDLVYNYEYTAWEFRYLTDKETFYEEAEYAVVCYDSVDEWITGLNLEKWKDKPNIDLERLQKFWEKEHNEN